MSAGRHAETPKWRRKVFGLPVFVWVFLLAGVALALFIVRVGTTGSVEGGSLDMQIQTTEPDLSDTCVLTVDTVTNTLDVTWASALAGDTCAVNGQYLAPASNTEDLLLQRFVSPAGLIATFNPLTPCGRVWAPGIQQGAFVDLAFDGSVSSIAFDPAIHGTEWVRASEFDPFLCNAETS